jgi:hypothetical protein
VDDHVKIHYSTTNPTTSHIRKKYQRITKSDFSVPAAVWMV